MKIYSGRTFLHKLLTWGYAGFTYGNFCCVIYTPYTADYLEMASLIAHESTHGQQVSRDGLLRYLWDYQTKADKRLGYELEGYAVSRSIDQRYTPERVSFLLFNKYRLDKHYSQENLKNIFEGYYEKWEKNNTTSSASATVN